MKKDRSFSMNWYVPFLIFLLRVLGGDAEEVAYW
jgi:hypothetical protein